MKRPEDHPGELRQCGTVYRLDLSDKDFGKIDVDIATGDLNRLLSAFFDSLPPKQKEKLEIHFKKVENAICDRTGNFAVITQPVLNKKVLKEKNDYIVEQTA